MKIYEFEVEDIRGTRHRINVEGNSLGDAKSKFRPGSVVEDCVTKEEYYTEKFLRRKLISEDNNSNNANKT
jgi:hypothetical protein